VFGFLHSKGARDVLVQALLAAPMFTTRWRWNAMRSLMLPRLRDGRRVPPALARMRAEDLLAAAFPAALACGETLPPGDIPVPLEHPMVRQTVDDCLHEAMDVDGLLALLAGLEQGTIEKRALDTSVPSAFAHGILSAQPYTFLDDAPLEERRTQAVMTRRTLDPAAADGLGALDPGAIARVREQAWPDPQGLEELHEALLWMGFLTQAEAVRCGWSTWLGELARAGRAEAQPSPAGAAPAEGGRRWFATEAPRAGREVLAGRLEALGPVDAEDPLIAGFAEEILQLEAQGAVLRTRVDGRPAWCNRRLLARIHRQTLERLRREIEPVSAADFLRFLARWQYAHPDARVEGPRGVLAVVQRLAGWQAPAAAWERHILPARVAGYRPAWLDELVLSGEVAWGRLWGAGAGPIRGTPIAIFPREQSEAWERLAGPGDAWSVPGGARPVDEALRARGACFPQELLRHTGLLPAQLEQALSDLVGLGLASCDSFAGLRVLLARRRRAGPPVASGRWTTFRAGARDTAAAAAVGAPGDTDAPPADFAARRLLARTGVVFRRTIERERLPVPWRELLRALRAMEVRGEVRGGRFVAGFPGEQYALPEAVVHLRAVRTDARAAGEGAGERAVDCVTATEPVSVLAADPLNFAGILTPDERVAATARRQVTVA
jgi:ATP-dependent Lhr-like helicase